MASRARWYIVQAHSGFEKKVAQSIKDQAVIQDLASFVEEVLVPVEEVTEVRKGKKVTSERKFFPGYVLAKMVMNDVTYHLVKNTPKVSGFLGASGKPFPISQKEVDHILQQVEEGIERPDAKIIYEVGEEVKVIDGPFVSFSGIVEEVDEERERPGSIKSHLANAKGDLCHDNHGIYHGVLHGYFLPGRRSGSVLLHFTDTRIIDYGIPSTLVYCSSPFWFREKSCAKH